MESVLQLYGLVMVILPVHAFVSLRKQFRNEQFAKLGAVCRYAGLVIAPVAMFAGLLALALGIEALTPFDVISDELVQGYVLALVLGVFVVMLGTAVFGLSMMFVQPARKPDFQKH